MNCVSQFIAIESTIFSNDRQSGFVQAVNMETDGLWVCSSFHRLQDV